ncbi:16S rRNA (cytidine(1402)-2'-O)-methyltransferase [Dactylosporangium vinaceum]|nr:16S rRNA (cytidine(1402)-2'-O)-methyltransferase [Dactylosporangium vinaceum]UAC01457.1 16S rRNA (cytidine(1402)-2'-O)-methyltransferase [Dactylosporangium vinaceum]
MAHVPLILLGAFPGNPGDASPRLRETLAAAEVVAPADLAGRLAAGDTVAMWTAGVPDPVRIAVDLGAAVTAVPGPSAAITALALSGLPSDRFCVESGAADLGRLAAEPRTLIFTEVLDLPALAQAFGADRPAALVAADRTAQRGTLGALIAPVASGGAVLVVGGAPPVSAGRPADGELAAEVAALVAGGADRKRATLEVARRHSLAKREVYAAVIAHK